MVYPIADDATTNIAARKYLRLAKRLAEQGRWERLLDYPLSHPLLPHARELLLEAAIQVKDHDTAKSIVWDALAAGLPQEWYLRLARRLAAAGWMDEASLFDIVITDPELMRRFAAMMKRRQTETPPADKALPLAG